MRNPLNYQDITEIFTREDVKFDIFKKLVQIRKKVRAITTKNTKNKPRSFFDGIDKWAKEQGGIRFSLFYFRKRKTIIAKGPVGKFFSENSLKESCKFVKLK